MNVYRLVGLSVLCFSALLLGVATYVNHYAGIVHFSDNTMMLIYLIAVFGVLIGSFVIAVGIKPQ
jgi:hypothetical protein